MKHPIIIMGTKFIGKQNFASKDLIFTKIYLSEDCVSDKCKKWTTEYLDKIMDLYNQKQLDFIFVDYSDEMLDLMIKCKIKFVVVAPYHNEYNMEAFTKRFYDPKYNHYENMSIDDYKEYLSSSLDHIKDKDKKRLIDVIWIDKSLREYDLPSAILRIFNLYLNDDILY